MSENRNYLWIAVFVVLFLVGGCASHTGRTEEESARTAAKDFMERRDNKLKMTHPETGDTVPLTVEQIHDEVKKTEGDRYLVRIQFTHPKGDSYDLDFYVDGTGVDFQVEDVVIHRINDKHVLPDQKSEQLNRES